MKYFNQVQLPYDFKQKDDLYIQQYSATLKSWTFSVGKSSRYLIDYLVDEPLLPVTKLYESSLKSFWRKRGGM